MRAAGIWADALRLGKPLMVDDFASVPAVALPDGHPEIARLLCAPTTEGGRPVMLAGVANRASAYDAEDAETLQLIMDTVWRVTERRRAERALRESEERRRVALEERKRIAEKQARLQANLAQADRLASMGRLAAGVAHEVNNPLAFVLYNLESLAEDLPAVAEAAERLQAALTARLEKPHEVFCVSDILIDNADIAGICAEVTGIRHALPERCDAGSYNAMSPARLKALGWRPGGWPLFEASVRELAAEVTA